MKKALLIFTFSIVSCVSLAQNFSITWSEKFKVTTGIFTNNIYEKSLPADKEAIISLFSKVKTSNFNNDYVIMKFNSKLEVEAQLELDYTKDAKEGFIDLVKLGLNYYLIEYRYTFKTTVDIILTGINIEKLQKSPVEKKIAEIDDSNGKPKMYGIGIGTMYDFKMNAFYSADSTKVLLTYEPEQSRKDTKILQMLVFDSGLEKVYAKTYEWDEPFKKIRICNTSVDNNGRTYVGYNLYEKNFDIDFKKSDGDKIPSYSTSMLIFDKGSKVTCSFDNDNKFIDDIGIAYNENLDPILIGIYKDKNNGRLSGVFKTPPIYSTTTKLKLAFTAFPPELLEKFDLDNQGKNGGNKPGLDNEFYLGYTVSVSDGVNHMIIEYFSRISRGDYMIFIKGDFLVTTFLAGDKVMFERLPRYQNTVNSVTSTNITSHNSFTPDYIDGKLFLFYNDDEDNANQAIEKKPQKFDNERKSVLLAGILSHDGKLVSRNIVYKHKDLDGFVTNLRFSRITENKYIVFAIKSGNFKHQTIAGILSVK